MNKIFKYLLISIFSLLLLPCFCSAENVSSLINYLTTQNLGSINKDNVKNVPFFTSSTPKSVYCFEIDYDYSSSVALRIGISDKTYDLPWGYIEVGSSDIPTTVCFYNGSSYVNVQPVVGSVSNVSIKIYNLNNFLNTTLPVLSSLECQTEYNLIPISSVTAQYCKINHDLIEPTECPSYEGTGEINRTARYINNEQYPGTASLNIFIPEFIKYSTTYNENQTLLDIEGYNADYEYIENVINNEKLTPTNEDFTTLITGITAFIPYLFIALLIFWFVKVINRIWK